MNEHDDTRAMVDGRLRGRAPRSVIENVNVVFADAATGLIRGYVSVQRHNIANQVIRDGEVAIEAAREPNLQIDKYIDLNTGELYPEAPVKKRKKSK